jgi:hypothetical protein
VIEIHAALADLALGPVSRPIEQVIADHVHVVVNKVTRLGILLHVLDGFVSAMTTRRVLKNQVVAYFYVTGENGLALLDQLIREDTLVLESVDFLGVLDFGVLEEWHFFSSVSQTIKFCFYEISFVFLLIFMILEMKFSLK